jgi:hypothetical protein
MVDFASYKKRQPMDVSQLVTAAEKAAGGRNREADARFWTPTRGKDGTGFAIIRFLPGIEENGVPWVNYWDHAFKGPTGQWYIEKSLTSLGQQDPLSELNMKMWNESVDGSPERKIVQSRRRNLHYVSNILVIKDDANPANEGKVFLYRYGKKIHDMVLGAMKPKFADQKPINPFDYDDGADFVLRIVSETVNGKALPKYDASSFKEPSKLAGGDVKVLEKIHNSQFAMGEFIDPANYKTYDELKSLLHRVLGESAPRTVKGDVALDSVAQPIQPKTAEVIDLDTSGGDDDITAMFMNLVNKD